MATLVERSCTELKGDRQDLREVAIRTLRECRSHTAYVLLGEPGSGKTVEFEKEANESSGRYVTARDFIAMPVESDWRDTTLFIDGLDEVRAGAGDIRNPFDAIRARLIELNHPNFRISCREADWYGPSDSQLLADVSPDRIVTQLRLNPLTTQNILQILSTTDGVADAGQFLRGAEARGLGDLLTNPQLLGLLVKATSGGNKWPQSRHETFRLACTTLLSEQNSNHQLAALNAPINTEQGLNAAGELSAIYLLAGLSGFSLSPSTTKPLTPYLHDIGGERKGLYAQVAKTNLFKCPGQVAYPVHRSVAEYLGASCLALKVNAGLPIGRVLALLVSDDGIPAAGLRGIAAWLAALLPRARPEMIGRDPIGTLIYGDVRDWSRAEKQELLSSLRKVAEQHPGSIDSRGSASSFGALCTPDISDFFQAALVSDNRSDCYQAYQRCVLLALKHGYQMPELTRNLVALVSERNIWEGNRRLALGVLIRYSQADPSGKETLVHLLNAVHSREVADPHDDILGMLLAELYPQVITPDQVFNHLHPPNEPHNIGMYFDFWNVRLVERTPDSLLASLLDDLVGFHKHKSDVLDDTYFRLMIGQILMRGLTVLGEQVEPKRISSWLRMATDRHGHSLLIRKEVSEFIRDWLARHPGCHKRLIEIMIREEEGKDRPALHIHLVRARLLNAEPPPDYGSWCLQQALNVGSEYEQRCYLTEAVWHQIRNGPSAGFDLEALEYVTERRMELKPILGELLVCRLNPALQKLNNEHKANIERRDHEHRKWVASMKSHLSEIANGTAPARILHDLAGAYFGYFIDAQGDTPAERLNSFLGQDRDFIKATLDGFKACLHREDVPDAAEILRIYSENHVHLLSRPCRAGMDLLAQESIEQIRSIGERTLLSGLAFHFTEGVGEDPMWLDELIKSNPALVAQAWTQYAIRAIRMKKDHIVGAYALAYDEDYDEVGEIAALKVLESFPVRCTSKQIETLNYLLKAAIRYTPRAALDSLVQRKLKLGSMNGAQKTCWLATAAIIGSGGSLGQLEKIVGKSRASVKYLAGFLSHRDEQWSPIKSLNEAALGLLIELLGPHYPPYKLAGTSWVSPAMEAADFLQALIAHLELTTTTAATDRLKALVSVDTLSKWKSYLAGALQRQMARVRDITYRHPSFGQVVQSLWNLDPANVADLAALVQAHIRDLAKQMQTANTNEYNKYWNEGGNNALNLPKTEEACRDIFLSDLRTRLEPLTVDAQPEGRYVAEKRSDIRVSYGGATGFNVPIEIKKNSHRDVWNSIREQLIPKYSRDPGAQGYGIYLVFWFGPEGTPTPPGGTRPKTAGALEQMLFSSLNSNEERQRISVCVIDCTKPR